MPFTSLLVQNIGEEKQLKNKKDDEEFDNNYHP